MRQDIEVGEEHRSDLQGAADESDSAEQQREQDELEANHDFSRNLWKLHLLSSCSRNTITICASEMLVSHPTEVC